MFQSCVTSWNFRRVLSVLTKYVVVVDEQIYDLPWTFPPTGTVHYSNFR